MTDYELVCKAKTDQNYMYYLYKKYENLIANVENTGNEVTILKS